MGQYLKRNEFRLFVLFTLVSFVALCLLGSIGCDNTSRALDCINGCSKTQGERGLTGAAGESIIGPMGPAGQDASGVTVVQLCNGTTTYPSTFVEVAFCIDNNLYATYSTNGGFSTLIPPGTYLSNGVNSNCTFTVSAGCLVTH